jgi:hypothetical protein
MDLCLRMIRRIGFKSITRGIETGFGRGVGSHESRCWTRTRMDSNVARARAGRRLAKCGRLAGTAQHKVTEARDRSKGDYSKGVADREVPLEAPRIHGQAPVSSICGLLTIYADERFHAAAPIQRFARRNPFFSASAAVLT